jgi:MFS family permease
MFRAAREATAVGTAMPTVVAELGGVSRYSWVFSIYLLTATVTIPVYGKLADLYGRRRLYLLAVALFVAGSVLSGAAASIEQLILFRAVQGVGAGGVMPLAVTLIGDLYSLEERARMQGLFSGVWGISSLVGPAVGGLLTDLLSWRWVVYFNQPFGIASAGATPGAHPAAVESAVSPCGEHPAPGDVPSGPAMHCTACTALPAMEVPSPVAELRPQPRMDIRSPYFVSGIEPEVATPPPKYS